MLLPGDERTDRGIETDYGAALGSERFGDDAAAAPDLEDPRRARRDTLADRVEEVGDADRVHLVQRGDGAVEVPPAVDAKIVVPAVIDARQDELPSEGHVAAR